MKEIWEQFESWLTVHWPEGLADLNPPATDQEIEELERGLGVHLPFDFVACLKVHNGQGNMAGGLFDNSEFLSTREILSQWKVWKDLLDSGDFKGIYSEPSAGVRNDWWNPKWIPVTHNGGGDHYCIDLDPTSEGRSGQVITMWHDMGNREVQANSFLLWLDQYVKAVLAGQYIYSEDFGGLIDVNYA
jgi:cell wall assembly regulator SMI1